MLSMVKGVNRRVKQRPWRFPNATGGWGYSTEISRILAGLASAASTASTFAIVAL